ncbi:MAG TPA: hypothetical protein VK936_09995 [Longimicrobiales bacterium]|nr:hypothetical protein [Longimicrobiales bacterium]
MSTRRCSALAAVGVAAIGLAAAEPAAATGSSGFVLAGATRAWVPGERITFAAAPPSIEKVEQNVGGMRVRLSRPQLPRLAIRRIWVTGPWLDYASSVTSAGGVSGRIANKRTLLGRGEVEIVVESSSSATRGQKGLRINIKCPPIPFTDCNENGVPLPVFVLATGPISSISPNGVVPSGQTMDFTLTGQNMNVARVVDPTVQVISRTATTIRLRRTTPSCGNILFQLYDEASGSRWDQDEQYALTPGFVHAHVGTVCVRNQPPPPTTGPIRRCPPDCRR